MEVPAEYILAELELANNILAVVEDNNDPCFGNLKIIAKCNKLRIDTSVRYKINSEIYIYIVTLSLMIM